MRVFGPAYSLQCLHSQRDFEGVASGVHSAIHGKIRPSNVRGLRTGDKRHHRSDLIHTPVTIERVAAFCGTAHSPAAGFKSVSIGPGATLFTVIPRLPTSLANPCENILTAPFV